MLAVFPILSFFSVYDVVMQIQSDIIGAILYEAYFALASLAFFGSFFTAVRAKTQRSFLRAMLVFGLLAILNLTSCHFQNVEASLHKDAAP